MEFFTDKVVVCYAIIGSNRGDLFSVIGYDRDPTGAVTGGSSIVTITFGCIL